MWKRIFSIALIGALSLALSNCASAPDTRDRAVTGPAAVPREAGSRVGVTGSFMGDFASDAIGEYVGVKTKTREETSKRYRHKLSGGKLLNIEDASASPRKVKAGERVVVKMTYALLSPSTRRDSTVIETREIRYKGKLFGKFKAYLSHTDGTYSSSVPLTLPLSAKKGRYQVTLTVHAQKTKTSRETFFHVN